MATEALWLNITEKYSLSENQLNLFKKYAEFLQKWNEVKNLTSITNLEDIIYYHFEDSLAISNFIDFNKINTICDIGTGAGFPGIPLKIKFEHLHVILIEVNQKKINFLNELIKELQLENIEVCPLDWRTFLRQTDYQIDLFFARASLQTDELLRLFKANSPYQNSQLIYWGSNQWQPTEQDLIYFKEEKAYKVGSKDRKYIFFNNKRLF